MSIGKLRKVEDAFSERLKMLRKDRGWSQEDLAARLDVSPGSVGNWEMGPHEPHPRTLRKIAALFEVDVFYLLRGGRSEGPLIMRDRPAEQPAPDLAGILREIEDMRDGLGRIAERLRKAATPSAATSLTEVASVTYDHRRGKGRAKETAESDAKRIVTKAEGQNK